jgi:hypothetical protein
MGVLLLDVETLARTRLSCSPAMEINSWLRITALSRRHPVLGDPGSAARSALGHPDVALLLDLILDGSSYVPDLLTPLPIAGSPEMILDQQLSVLSSVTAAQLEEQLFVHTLTHWGRLPPPRICRLAESGALARRLADGIRRFWREAMRERWKSVWRALENDIVEKMTIMGRAGIGRLLESTYPGARWLGNSLEIGAGARFTADLSGRELVLAPVASHYSWPVIQVGTPGQAALYFPARGIGAARGPQGGLGRAVGQVRAALLADLSPGRTTTELATRHGYSPGTISYHLSALYGAELVTKHRLGRRVVYARTDRATALLRSR